jgi:hypothetical protein
MWSKAYLDVATQTSTVKRVFAVLVLCIVRCTTLNDRGEHVFESLGLVVLHCVSHQVVQHSGTVRIGDGCKK